MKFENKFWPDDCAYFHIENERKGYYPKWKPLKDSEKHILMCSVTGEEAKRVEQIENKDQIKKEISEILKNAFGKSKPDENFTPQDIFVTNWSTDPNFLGSYSYFPVQAFNYQGATMQAMRCSIGNDRVFFAGEAYDDKYFAYVHGAKRNGEMVGQQIIRLIQ